ncbi:MAG TPA: NADP-dependent oxidoreductase [Woeseiaceae bacterium]|nr:NADP-dependent oxidoreductase [Woeseiaceae bacterium]
MTATNRQVRLASRPAGPVTPELFSLTEAPVPEPGPGEVLVRNVYLSVDPYMRGRMNDAKSYVPPFAVGEVLTGGVVGRVAASRNPAFREGEWVNGLLGWETYSLTSGQGLYKLPDANVPKSWWLGVLGTPGMTAYVGLFEIGRAQAGETVFISAAAGAVGSVAGQLAKIHGCRVAGCAGSDEKVALLLNELGFDAAFNYRTSESLRESLRKVCPGGIDVDFENVGGDLLEAALRHMRPFGRIVLCGMIAQYDDTEPRPGPRGLIGMIGKRLTMRGFIVTDHPETCREYVPKALRWLEEGRLEYRETIAEGIENAPAAFIDMLQGNKIGKQIVRLAAED